MNVRSLCPFSIGTLTWEPHPGEQSLSLCVKGTFTLVPGAEAVLAEVQRPIEASDGVPIKRRPDVTVTGSDLRVRVGGVDRCEVIKRREAIAIHGPSAGPPRFEGRLPGLWPKVLRFPPRGVYEEVGLRCDTLLIDADHALAVLWWRGVIVAPGGDLGALGTIVVVAEEVNQRAHVEVIERWVRTSGAAPPAHFLQEAAAASPSPLAQRRERIKKTVPADDLEGPTTKMPAPPVELIEAAIEVTADALPTGMMRPVLPFDTPPPPLAPAIAAPPAVAAPVEPPRLGPSLLLTESPDVAQVATLASKLASGSAKTLLAARGLTAETWGSVERRCLERLANEAEEGGAELRDEYDEAFLAAEALRRGPFEIEHLARLRLDLETGEAKPDDAGLALDVAAAMRARRLWARR